MEEAEKKNGKESLLNPIWHRLDEELNGIDRASSLVRAAHMIISGEMEGVRKKEDPEYKDLAAMDACLDSAADLLQVAIKNLRDEEHRISVILHPENAKASGASGRA